MAYTHALVVDNLVRQRFESDPNLPAPWRVIDISASPDVEEGWVVADDGSVSAPPPPVPVVPVSISQGQALIGLSRMTGSAKGKSLLDDASAAVATKGGELAIWFDKEPVWRRPSPYVAQFAKAVKWSDDDMDAFFRDAGQIAV